MRIQSALRTEKLKCVKCGLPRAEIFLTAITVYECVTKTDLHSVN